MSSKRTRVEKKSESRTSESSEGLTWTVRSPKDDGEGQGIDIVLRDRDIWSGSAPIPADLSEIAPGVALLVKIQICPEDRDIWSKPVTIELRGKRDRRRIAKSKG